MAKSITPTSAVNMLRCSVVGYFAANVGAAWNSISALFRDSAADALYSQNITAAGTSHRVIHRHQTPLILAASTSNTIFKWRCGASAASTTTFNGISGARELGASNKSTIAVEEIQV